MYRRCVSSGGLELFWFLASTIFVQLGSRLRGWKRLRLVLASSSRLRGSLTVLVRTSTLAPKLHLIGDMCDAPA